jgi:hypothetical protein
VHNLKRTKSRRSEYPDIGEGGREDGVWRLSNRDVPFSHTSVGCLSCKCLESSFKGCSSVGTSLQLPSRCCCCSRLQQLPIAVTP